MNRTPTIWKDVSCATTEQWALSKFSHRFLPSVPTRSGFLLLTLADIVTHHADKDTFHRDPGWAAPSRCGLHCMNALDKQWLCLQSSL